MSIFPNLAANDAKILIVLASGRAMGTHFTANAIAELSGVVRAEVRRRAGRLTRLELAVFRAEGKLEGYAATDLGIALADAAEALGITVRNGFRP